LVNQLINSSRRFHNPLLGDLGPFADERRSNAAVSLADLPDAELHDRVTAHPGRRLRPWAAVAGAGLLVHLLVFSSTPLAALPVWGALALVMVWPTSVERELRRRFGPTLEALASDRVDGRALLVAEIRFRPGHRVAARIEDGRATLYVLEKQRFVPRSGRRAEVPCDSATLIDLARRADLFRLDSPPTGLPIAFIHIDPDGLATGWRGDAGAPVGDGPEVELVRALSALLGRAA